MYLVVYDIWLLIMYLVGYDIWLLIMYLVVYDIWLLIMYLGWLWYMIIDYVPGCVWYMIIDYVPGCVWYMIIDYVPGLLWYMIIDYVPGLVMIYDYWLCSWVGYDIWLLIMYLVGYDIWLLIMWLETVSLFRSELKMNVQIRHRLQSYLNDWSLIVNINNLPEYLTVYVTEVLTWFLCLTWHLHSLLWSSFRSVVVREILHRPEDNIWNLESVCRFTSAWFTQISSILSEPTT